MKKVSCSKTQNSFFADHFRFSGEIWRLLMYIAPLGDHIFSSFLFYQELRTVKNYRAFRFKLPDKILISLRRFTISPLECRWFIKICSFSFFRIRSAIAQQITWDRRQYCTSFGVHPTWTRCAAAFAFPASPIVHAKTHVERSNFSSHTSQPPANDIYVKCTFWWHFLFSTTVPWLYSKDDFRIAMVHSFAEKIRSDGCWRNMFPCVSHRIVVDYDEFG